MSGGSSGDSSTSSSVRSSVRSSSGGTNRRQADSVSFLPFRFAAIGRGGEGSIFPIGPNAAICTTVGMSLFVPSVEGAKKKKKKTKAWLFLPQVDEEGLLFGGPCEATHD